MRRAIAADRARADVEIRLANSKKLHELKDLLVLAGS
jgi:hypothetical protein